MRPRAALWLKLNKQLCRAGGKLENYFYFQVIFILKRSLSPLIEHLEAQITGFTLPFFLYFLMRPAIISINSFGFVFFLSILE